MRLKKRLADTVAHDSSSHVASHLLLIVVPLILRLTSRHLTRPSAENEPTSGKAFACGASGVKARPLANGPLSLPLLGCSPSYCWSEQLPRPRFPLPVRVFASRLPPSPIPWVQRELLQASKQSSKLLRGLGRTVRSTRFIGARVMSRRPFSSREPP